VVQGPRARHINPLERQGAGDGCLRWRRRKREGVRDRVSERKRVRERERDGEIVKETRKKEKEEREKVSGIIGVRERV
jgi:hypothetical protein